MDSQIALESLLQHGRSDLYKDMVSLYKKSQDALISDPRASAKKVNLTLKEIGFVEDLKSIVKKHMNLKIARVVMMESIEPNAMAVMSEPKGGYPLIKRKEYTYGMIMEKINNLYNDKTGYISESSQDVFGFNLSMFISTSFWTLKDKNGDFYFTPEEVAAITLHEIGHFDHLIRAFYRAHSKIIDASDVITYVKQAPDKEVLLKLLNKVKSSKVLDKSWDKIIKTTEEYFTTTNAFDKQEYIEAINTLCVIATAGLSNVTLHQFDLGTSLVKQSEVFGTKNKGLKDFILDAERTADEFSARNGAYKDLVSSVLKIHELVDYKYHLIIAQKSLYRQKTIFYLLKQFNQYTGYYAEDIISRYDPLFRRIELIIETAKHAFSDPHLPSEVKIELKQQILDSEKYLKDYKSKYRNDFREDFNQWKNNVSKFSRILRAPFEDRLRDDYNTLQESTRHLTRNPLYYIAEK